MDGDDLELPYVKIQASVVNALETQNKIVVSGIFHSGKSSLSRKLREVLPKEVRVLDLQEISPGSISAAIEFLKENESYIVLTDRFVLKSSLKRLDRELQENLSDLRAILRKAFQVEMIIDQEDASQILQSSAQYNALRSIVVSRSEARLSRSFDSMVQKLIQCSELHGTHVPMLLLQNLQKVLEDQEISSLLNGTFAATRRLRDVFENFDSKFFRRKMLNSAFLAAMATGIYVEGFSEEDISPFISLAKTESPALELISTLGTPGYLLLASLNEGDNAGQDTYLKIFSDAVSNLRRKTDLESRILCYIVDIENGNLSGHTRNVIASLPGSGNLDDFLRGEFGKLKARHSERIGKSQQKNAQQTEDIVGMIKQRIAHITRVARRYLTRADYLEVKSKGALERLSIFAGIPEFLVDTEDRAIRDLLERAIEKSASKVLVITGEPGAGKTTFLYLVASRLLEQSQEGSRLFLVNPSRYMVALEDGNYRMILEADDEIGHSYLADLLREDCPVERERFIVTVDSEVLSEVLSLPGVSNERLEVIDLKYPVDVARRIAVHYLDTTGNPMITNNQEEALDLVLRKFHDNPFYLREFALYIDRRSQELKTWKKVSATLKRELPEGADALAFKILGLETMRDPKLPMVYYIVSHYGNFPSRLEEYLGRRYMAEQPYFTITNQRLQIQYLHPVYRIATDELFSSSRVKKRNTAQLALNRSGLSDLIDAAVEYVPGLLRGVSAGAYRDWIVPAVEEALQNMSRSQSGYDRKTDLVDAILVDTIDFMVRNEFSDGFSSGGFSFRSIGNSKVQQFRQLMEFVVKQCFTGKSLSDLEEGNRPIFNLLVYTVSRFFHFRSGNPVNHLMNLTADTAVDLLDFAIEMDRVERKMVHFLVSALMGSGYFGPLKSRSLQERFLLEIAREDYEGARMMCVAGMESGINVEFSRFLEGVALLYMGRHEDALKSFDLALKAGYDKPMLHYFSGLARSSMGSFEEAVSEFREACNSASDRHSFRKALARSLVSLGKYGEAVSEYEKAIVYDSEIPDYYNYRGEALQAMGDLTRALDDFSRAIYRDSNEAEYHYNKGKVLFSLDRIMEAQYEFDRALELSPDRAEYHSIKGLVFQKQKNYSAAIASFSRAIELEPENAVYHFNRGFALQKIGQYPDSVIEFDNAITLDPGNPEYHYRKGRSLYSSGLHRDAAASYHNAIELDQENPEYYFNRGLAHLKLSNNREAVGDFETALSLDKDNLEYRKRYARALNMVGKYQEAIDQFDLVLKQDANSADCHYEKGFSLYCLGNYPQAIREYDVAARLDPNYSSVYNAKGLLLYNLSRYQEGLPQFERAVTLKPDNSEYRYNLGLVLHQLGRFRDAIEEFERSVKLDPNNPNYHFGLGLSLKSLSEHSRAIKEFQSAIDLDPDESEYHYHKGLSYYSMGNFSESYRAIDKACRLNPGRSVYFLSKGITSIKFLNQTRNCADLELKNVVDDFGRYAVLANTVKYTPDVCHTLRNLNEGTVLIPCVRQALERVIQLYC